CALGLQWDAPAEARGLEGRPGDGPAGCRRGLARRPSGPARPGPRQTRSGARSPTGCRGDRRATQAAASARGGAPGRRLRSLPGPRYEVEAITQLFKSNDRPARVLLGADASEPELDRLAAAGALARSGFIHLMTHGVIDEDVPTHSAVILTQTGLPDPL